MYSKPSGPTGQRTPVKSNQDPTMHHTSYRIVQMVFTEHAYFLFFNFPIYVSSFFLLTFVSINLRNDDLDRSSDVSKVAKFS